MTAEQNPPPPPSWRGRPIVCCHGGPYDGRWYFTDDLTALQASATAMQQAGQTGPRIALDYTLTTERVGHPDYDTTGHVARYGGDA